MTRLGRVGVGVIVLGTVPFVVMELWAFYEAHRWTRLDIPISLRKGEIRSPTFIVEPSARYQVTISFNRSIDIDRMDCLLHIELAGDKGKCRAIPEADDIGWTAFANGHKVAAGSSRDYRWGAYGDRIAKIIGSFDATGRAQCKIILNFRQEATELEKADPRLEVTGSATDWKGVVVLTQLSFFAAILFSALGIFLILLSRGLQRKTIRLGLTP